MNDNVLAMRTVRHALIWLIIILCAVLVGVYVCIAIKEFRWSCGFTEPSDTSSRAAACCARTSSCCDKSWGEQRMDCDKRRRWIRAFTWIVAFVMLLTAAVAITLRSKHPFSVFLRFVKTRLGIASGAIS